MCAPYLLARLSQSLSTYRYDVNTVDPKLLSSKYIIWKFNSWTSTHDAFVYAKNPLKVDTRIFHKIGVMLMHEHINSKKKRIIYSQWFTYNDVINLYQARSQNFFLAFWIYDDAAKALRCSVPDDHILWLNICLMNISTINQQFFGAPFVN